MNRRDFQIAAAAAAAAALLSEGAQAQGMHAEMFHPKLEGPPTQVAMVIFPGFVTLDLIGPHTFFKALGNVEVRLVSADGAPVRSDTGLIYPADASFATCPKDLDILFVPGGLKGSIKQMRDPATLDFLADRGGRAKYITGICTGTLVLGAAGLLKGYKATGNWQVRQLLPLMGAELVPDRVVIDRNRITGAGVTAGIDFGLQIVAMLRGEPYARMLQLVFEYDPHPPFNSGSPTTASKALVDHLMTSRAADIEAARLAAVASPAG